MVGIGTFLGLGVAAVILFLTTQFGEQFGRGAGGIGSGLASFGSGIQSFVSSATSPTIAPFVRPTLDLSRVLPGLQAGLGQAGRAIQGRDPVDGTDDETDAGAGSTIGTAIRDSASRESDIDEAYL